MLTMGLTTGVCTGDCGVTAKHKRHILSQESGRLSQNMRRPGRVTHPLLVVEEMVTIAPGRVMRVHDDAMERMVVMVVVAMARHLISSKGAWQVMVGKCQDMCMVLAVRWQVWAVGACMRC